jgi:hypothetical protein
MPSRETDVDLPDLSGVQRIASTSLTALTAISPASMIGSGVAATHAVSGTANAVAGTANAVAGTATTTLEAVKKPLDAAAAGTKMSTLSKVATVVGKSLAGVVIVTSTIQGVRLVEAGGPEALIDTKQGRSAVLGASGGALALTPMPATQLAGALVLAAAAANEFGAFDKLNKPNPATAPKPPG